MIKVDGFKAFKGTMKITPVCKDSVGMQIKPFIIQGQWLYKPEYGCWYSAEYGSSYSESICEVVEDLTK